MSDTFMHTLPDAHGHAVHTCVVDDDALGWDAHADGEDEERGSAASVSASASPETTVASATTTSSTTNTTASNATTTASTISTPSSTVDEPDVEETKQDTYGDAEAKAGTQNKSEGPGEEGLGAAVMTTKSRDRPLKGKGTRSWAQLPGEVVRLIASYHRLNASASYVVPAVYEPPLPQRPTESTNAFAFMEAERRVWLAALDALAMETVMSLMDDQVETHSFWDAAIEVYDPTRATAHYAQPAPPNQNNNTSNSNSSAGAPMTPYRHLRLLTGSTCLLCRLAMPHAPAPLLMNNVRRTQRTLHLGYVPACKDHSSTNTRRDRWCGMCLRDPELARSGRAELVKSAREEEMRWRWADDSTGTGTHTAEEVRARRSASAARARACVDEEERFMVLTASWPPAVGCGVDLSVAVKAVLPAIQAQYHAQQYPHYYNHPHTAQQQAHLVGWLENRDGLACVGEKDRSFPGINVTCRGCRGEWIWRAAVRGVLGEGDAERVGRGLSLRGLDLGSSADGSRSPSSPQHSLLAAIGITYPPSPDTIGMFRPRDLLTRGALTNLLDLGEGTVDSLLRGAAERAWLARQTRWNAMMREAVEARRLGVGRRSRRREQQQRRRAETPGPRARFENTAANQAAYARAGYVPDEVSSDEDSDVGSELGSDEMFDSEAEDEEESEEEDEVEMAENLDAAVRDMALGDWARARILSGRWTAPADEYYAIGTDPEKTMHPLPWSVSTSPTPPSRTPPLPPPSDTLTHFAQVAYGRQMRAILGPAMLNVVRRVAMSDDASSDDVPDAVLRISRVTLPAVLRTLREDETAWYDGEDILSAIPRIPVPAEPDTPGDILRELGPAAADALWTTWREACRDVYVCSCSICSRAEAAALAAETDSSAANHVSSVRLSLPAPPVVPVPASREEEEEGDEQDPLVIEIPSEYDVDEDEDGLGVVSIVIPDSEDDVDVPEPLLRTARKRSVDECELDDGDDDRHGKRLDGSMTSEAPGTPPKRARLANVPADERWGMNLGLAKRGSEELEAEEAEIGEELWRMNGIAHGGRNLKRARGEA
ncbi:unnamed protein product [Mycena citricolor]|uniref:Uncharacterized protein n=1 Tax=Mycena citricolor TaxID=2018698 RepID=A0AAD2H055_9AGAR|nr:unnamed protein product [Mycena citricolor]